MSRRWLFAIFGVPRSYATLHRAVRAASGCATWSQAQHQPGCTATDVHIGMQQAKFGLTERRCARLVGHRPSDQPRFSTMRCRRTRSGARDSDTQRLIGSASVWTGRRDLTVQGTRSG